MTATNSPKFTFFYLLSLVGLIFTTISSGMILFQIINKFVPDPLIPGMLVDMNALKFAISAILIAAPLYFVLSWLILKSLRNGELEADSAIRRWLHYFVMLVTAVVVFGWFVTTVLDFFNGDLSLKIGLKSLTAILLAGLVFSYYFFSIRTAESFEQKRKAVNIYFYGSIILVAALFVVSLFIVDSPATTRARRQDEANISKLYNIKNQIDFYYETNKKLPANLDELIGDVYHLQPETLENMVTKKKFEYKIISKDTYEICTDFQLSNKAVDNNDSYSLGKDEWPHDSGYQCVKQKAVSVNMPAFDLKR